jgi:hypothetical protein
LSKKSSEDAVLDGETDPVQVFITMASPADSGSCAITAVIDAENDGLYIASTGDCRAVAGWQDAQGRWRCDILSEDQVGDNPKEIARCVVCLSGVAAQMLILQNAFRTSIFGERYGVQKQPSSWKSTAHESFR